MSETLTMTITEFLLARITEDEDAALAASPGPWRYGNVESVAGGTLYDATRSIADLTFEQRSDHDGTIVRHLLSYEADANGHHMARYDPTRVLAECAAKRHIVEWHKPLRQSADEIERGYLPNCEGCWEDGGMDGAPLYPCRTVRWLASVYADHPDYDEAWAV